MRSRNDNDVFAALWGRVVYDPLLPWLRSAQDDGTEPAWWVEDGRVVVEPPGWGGPAGPGHRPALDSGRSSSALAAAELAPLAARLIGRERESELLHEAVRAQRLVTLHGPPGLGKTRLAQHLVADLHPHFRNRIWVDLSGVTDPELVGMQVSVRLGVQQGGESFTRGDRHDNLPFTERLAEKLRDRDLLLVLDNCEHVLDECRALVVALLRRCPSVHVLCTSRVPLDLPDEVGYELEPLSVPSGAEPDVEDVLVASAVRLFLDRVHAVGEILPDHDLRTVAEICKHLEGVPYAIELGAAQVGKAPLTEILERLGSLRRSAERTADARQPVAEAAVAWSYHLLPEAQQLVLRRLAVFRGAFTVDAAVEIGAGDGITEAEAKEALEALLAARLLVKDPYDSTPRFSLLETTRAYAAAQLRRSDDELRVHARLQVRYLRVAEEMEPQLRMADQVELLDHLEGDLANLRAALLFDDAEGALRSLRTICALDRFWITRGLLSEGRVHLDRALAVAVDRTDWRAKGLAVASKLANLSGQFDTARRLAQEASRLAQDLGVPAARALALQQLGIEAHQRGRLMEADLLCRASLRLCREFDDWGGLVMSLNRLGGIAESQGDFSRARSLYEEARDACRASGDVTGLAWSLHWLGRLSVHQGRGGEAKELLEESLLLARRLGYRQQIVLALIGMGTSAYLSGDWTVAETHFLEALAAAASLQDRTSAVVCSAALAELALVRGDLEAANWTLRAHKVDDSQLAGTARAALLASAAHLARASGDHDRSEQLHRRALEWWLQVREYLKVPDHLEELALIAFDRGQMTRAAILLAAAERYRRRMHTPVPPVRGAAVERAADLLCGGEAWERGARLDDEAVFAFALSGNGLTYSGSKETEQLASAVAESSTSWWA